MAIFHCQAKAISRSAGRSATAAAAYRAGELIHDKRTGEVHDYSRKKGIEYSEIITSDGTTITRENLWNAAEEAEKRKDAKVAREWEIALPSELSQDQQRELARSFARELDDLPLVFSQNRGLRQLVLQTAADGGILAHVLIGHP